MSRRRIEVAPGLTYREWVNVRRNQPCVCRKDGVAAQIATGSGILSFRFGINITRKALLGYPPEKAAMLFGFVATLHNCLRQLAGLPDATPEISAEGLAEQVLRQPRRSDA
jgi:hypothetical protein